MFSTVVPVFNSSDVIDELASRLVGFFQKKKINYELIFVDDRSSDNSWERIKNLAKNNFHIVGIRLKKNYGQLAATTCGIENSKGDIIITIDDDLQFAPEEIGKLLETKKKFTEPVLILGSPKQKQQSMARIFFSKLFHLLFLKFFLPSFHGKNIFTSFRMMDKKITEQWTNKNGFHLYYFWEINPKTVQCVEVHHSPRISGKTNYTFPALVKAYLPAVYFLFAKFFFIAAIFVFLAGIWMFIRKENLFFLLVLEIFCLCLVLFLKKKLNQNKKINYIIDEIT